MSDRSAGAELGVPAAPLRVELVWGIPGAFGQQWIPATADAAPHLQPTPQEVEAVYAAASAEPPLSEDQRFATWFASIYDAAVKAGRVLTAFSRHDDRLASFAYGHFWTWAEQTNPWAAELRLRLGEAAQTIEWTYTLSLLARDPSLRESGVGRRTLEAWLSGIAGFGCWLQTDDIDSPARRLYDSVGFVAIGHGPEAPNGEPGLVMYRPPS
ncbi:hypothetical protein DFO66_101194 [Brevibacterium sanguinis]|uniref:Acetyltransferase (GNAT) family protein n=2 Tax=Brevibacterium TaxID=1696 RepID=A0A366INF7_9MICO|nr:MULTISPECIES: hypothetical protein [Brevibacterium]RBP67970.1 hypothetical protein DFO66_101194 [Brevibacterium sanguinis]RBP74613.1 hypothetical protein DFO65_101335 [Brevibacterium celere]